MKSKYLDSPSLLNVFQKYSLTNVDRKHFLQLLCIDFFLAKLGNCLYEARVFSALNKSFEPQKLDKYHPEMVRSSAYFFLFLF